jgi:transposase
MMIIGCDLHTRYQQIAMVDTDTGEMVESRLEHANGEARAFYAALQSPVRVGIEATGYTHWFEALLAELGHELWMGDAARCPRFRVAEGELTWECREIRGLRIV